MKKSPKRKKEEAIKGIQERSERSLARNQNLPLSKPVRSWTLHRSLFLAPGVETPTGTAPPVAMAPGTEQVHLQASNMVTQGIHQFEAGLFR